MPAHSGDTTDFPDLTFAQQASSITAMLNNIESAIEHHARHSPQGSAATGAKCVAQVERLLGRLRTTFPATAPAGAPDAELGAADVTDNVKLRHP